MLGGNLRCVMLMAYTVLWKHVSGLPCAEKLAPYCSVGFCVSASESSDELSELLSESLPEPSSSCLAGAGSVLLGSSSSSSLELELEDSVSGFAFGVFFGTEFSLGRGTSLRLGTPFVLGRCIAMFTGVFVFAGFAFGFGAGVSVLESSLLSIFSLLNGRVNCCRIWEIEPGKGTGVCFIFFIAPVVPSRPVYFVQSKLARTFLVE